MDNEQHTGEHRTWRARVRRLTVTLGRGATVTVVAIVVALLAALLVTQGAARAGHGSGLPPLGQAGSSSSNSVTPTSTSTTLQRHALAPLVATDTPQPTPTDTPPPPPPPAPTSTPAPLPITLGCFTATAQPGNPDWYRYETCVGAPAGSTYINLSLWYCNSTVGPDSATIASMPASGTYNATWTRGPVGCAAPFTVSVTAKGTSADGQQLSGSATFTVSA